MAIDDAERSERDTIVRDQRGAGIKSDKRLAGDEGIAREARIGRRIRYDHQIAMGHRMRAEGCFPRCLVSVQPDFGKKSLPFRFYQTDKGDWRRAKRRCEGCDVIKPRSFGKVK